METMNNENLKDLIAFVSRAQQDGEGRYSTRQKAYNMFPSIPTGTVDFLVERVYSGKVPPNDPALFFQALRRSESRPTHSSPERTPPVPGEKAKMSPFELGIAAVILALCSILFLPLFLGPISVILGLVAFLRVKSGFALAAWILGLSSSLYGLLLLLLAQKLVPPFFVFAP